MSRLIRTRITSQGLVTVHLSRDEQSEWFIITGPDGAIHRLAAHVTPAERLQAHLHGFCEQYGGVQPHTERRLTATQMSLLREAGMDIGEGIEFLSGSSVAITDARVLATAVSSAYQHVNGGEDCAESAFAYRAMEKSADAIEARWCQFQTNLNLDLFWSEMAD
jgi:hypothetical protein